MNKHSWQYGPVWTGFQMKDTAPPIGQWIAQRDDDEWFYINVAATKGDLEGLIHEGRLRMEKHLNE